MIHGQQNIKFMNIEFGGIANARYIESTRRKTYPESLRPPLISC
jgi:hypothetical protein